MARSEKREERFFFAFNNIQKEKMSEMTEIATLYIFMGDVKKTNTYNKS